MRRAWVAGLGLLVLGGLARAQAAPQRWADALRLAERIDGAIVARWAARGMTPAQPADDGEFLRRVSLDLGGCIPRVSLVREFLRDHSADKRRRAVDRLLASPAYASNFAQLWQSRLLPADSPQDRFGAPALEAWLREQFHDNVPYDQMVRSLLTVSTDPQPEDRALGASVYYSAQGYRPENLAASTSRIFLGVKVECAQCHNHPFASWTRQQFWEYAAFFTRLTADGPARTKNGLPPEIQISGTDRLVQARFLDGKRPPWQKGVEPRRYLADWITRPDNPYFARAEVNRLWAHFFGAGLLEPVDDLSAGNAPSHPELLDELCRQFIAHGYDVQFVIRAITASRAYQLSSATRSGGADEPGLFAHMAVKGLSAEQLYESFLQATGYRDQSDVRRRFFGQPTSPRSEFLARFTSQDRPIDARTSILQALALMNGKLVADATDLERSETLAAVASAPFLDTPEKRVTTLFLATLSRRPRTQELDRFAGYVRKAGNKGEKAALADVFWALLNSSEFALNH